MRSDKFPVLLFFILFHLITVSPPLQGETALLSLWINEVSRGEIQAIVEEDQLYIETDMLTEFLAPLVEEDYFLTLRSIGKASLSLTDLNQLDIKTRIDYSDLSIHLLVPSIHLREQNLGRTVTNTLPRGMEVYPAPISAYVNGNLRISGLSNFHEEPRIGTGFDMDGAINIKAWVLEAAGTLQAEETVSGEFKQYRLIRDLREWAYRFSLGTVTLPSTHLSGRLAGLGFMITSYPEAGNFTVSTQRSPRLMDSIIIEKNARIIIKVNGITVRTMNVPPGKYRIHDIPLASGFNDVAIRIEEEGKEEVEYVLGLPYEGSILAQGLSRMSFGAASLEQTRFDPIASFTFDYGIFAYTEAMTGLHIGINAISASLGIRSATKYGYFSLEGALSRSEAGMGFNTAAIYRLGFPGRPLLPRFGLGAEYKTTQYATPASSGVFQPKGDLWHISAQVTQNIPSGIALALATDYGSPDGISTSFGIALGAHFGLGKGSTLSVSSSIDNRQGSITPSISMSLMIIPDGSATVTRYEQALMGGESNVDFSWNNGSQVGAYNVAFGLTNPIGPEEKPSSITGNVQRKGHFFDTSFSSQYSLDRVLDNSALGMAMTMNGSLVYADGLFAPSRRVNDSFVILKADEAFGTAKVELNAGASSKASATGGKVDSLGGLTAYTRTIAYVDTPEAPPDIRAREQILLLNPTYKSGLVVRPEKNIHIYAMGTINKAENTALSWAAGTILDQSGTVIDEFFTDEEGHFELYDLNPGTYTLVLEHDGLRFTIEIPKGSEGLVELGTLGERKEIDE